MPKPPPLAASFAINRANWDDRAGAHVRSPDYEIERFVTERDYMSKVVRFDQDRLGDLRGRRTVHLQCHIGTDTLSLARLGATVSALDFSSASIDIARQLAHRAGADIDYREGNVYDAVDVFGAGRFDLVYTGIGALCWLPDIRRWGQVVADLLADGGRLFIREGHPVLWSLDELKADRLSIELPYFEQAEPEIYDEQTTYVRTDVALTETITHSWNHGIGEIVTALLDAGLHLTMLVEHDSVPWDALPGQMAEDDQGEWRLREGPARLPASYTLQAVKPVGRAPAR